jgi:UDPglucose--hexose-1-phosphate uridylyltransferase
VSQRRLNLLTGDWVLVSPERIARPWQGAVDPAPAQAGAAYEPDCYLCPGNARAAGRRNANYSGVHVFDNDFPSLSAHATAVASDSLLQTESESGVCRVICYSPDHSRAMSQMPATQIRAVIDVWTAQFAELAARPDIGAVTTFENRGEMMGASNPHPHGQLWATQTVPNELAREDARQRDGLGEHGRPLLADYLARELEGKARIVCANDAFVALVPYWAAWPFETLLLPRRFVSALDQLTSDEADGLADVLSRVTRAYDALFGVPFPYSMGIHQRPTRQPDSPHFTLHVHFYPPLLRSASVRKFMVGFEMLAMPQRDMTPEDAADRLRAVL